MWILCSRPVMKSSESFAYLFQELLCMITITSIIKVIKSIMMLRKLLVSCTKRYHYHRRNHLSRELIEISWHMTTCMTMVVIECVKWSLFTFGDINIVAITGASRMVGVKMDDCWLVVNSVEEKVTIGSINLSLGWKMWAEGEAIKALCQYHPFPSSQFICCSIPVMSHCDSLIHFNLDQFGTMSPQ